jgi:PST family polysaccharide transporter
VIGGVTGVLLATHGWGVNALVGQQIVTSTISTSLLWLVCPWQPDFRFSLIAAREILGFMWRILPFNIVYALNQNCDTFLIAFLFGPESAGIYNVAKRVKLALQLVAGNPINAIGLPALAEIQDNPERLRFGILKSLNLISAICCPIFFGASAVAQEAVILVFGHHWLASIPVMQWLSLGGLAMLLSNFDDNVFVLTSRPTWCLVVALSYASLAVIFVVVFEKWGFGSLALPFVLPYAVALPLSALLMSRRVKLRLSTIIAAILPGLSAAILMFAAVSALSEVLPFHSNMLRLSILCGFGILTYTVSLFIFWRRTASVIFEMLRGARRRKNLKAVAS